MMLNSFKSLVKKQYRIGLAKFQTKFHGPQHDKWTHWSVAMYLMGADSLNMHFLDRDHFTRNAKLSTLEVECIPDIAEIAGVLEGLMGKDFISLYVRGGVAVRQFSHGFSDLDLVVVTRNSYIGGQDLNLFLKERLETRYPKYTKVDLGFVTVKEAESEGTKWNIILRMEGVLFAGKNINVNAPVYRMDPTLWSLYSGEPFILKQINKYLLKDKIQSRDLLKCLIRAVFECSMKRRPAYYSKDLILITNMASDQIIFSGHWFVGFMISGLFRDYSMLCKGYDLEPSDKMRLVSHVFNAVRYINGERNEDNFIYP